MADVGIRTLLSYNLKRIRKERGLSQEQLAEEIDTSRKSICAYESCVSFPSPEMIDRIASVLDVSVADLFLRKDESLKIEFRLTDEIIDKAVEKMSENLKQYTRDSVSDKK